MLRLRATPRASQRRPVSQRRAAGSPVAFARPFAAEAKPASDAKAPADKKPAAPKGGDKPKADAKATGGAEKAPKPADKAPAPDAKASDKKKADKDAKAPEPTQAPIIPSGAASLDDTPAPAAKPKKVVKQAHTGPVELRAVAITHTKLREIKRERFGRELESFKLAFERPIVALFDQISTRKAMKKKSVVRKAKKRHQAEVRASEAEALAAEKNWNQTTEFELEDLLNTEMQAGPVSVSDFAIGHSERMRKFNPALNPDSPLKKVATNMAHYHNPMRWEPGRKAGWMFLPEYLRGAFPNGYVRGTEPDDNEWQRSLVKLELVKHVSRQMRDEYELLVPDNIELYQTIADRMRPGTHPWGSRLKEKLGRAGKKLLRGKLPAHSIKDEYTGQDVWFGDVDKVERPVFEVADAFTPFVKKEHFINRRSTEGKAPPQITKLTPDHPFSLLTWTISNFSTREEKNKTRYRYVTRKAVLSVLISELGLPRRVRNRLVEMAGKRFDPETGVLRISASKRPNVSQNRALAVALFRSMVSEAWKADLNFLPRAVDPVAPIQRLETEFYREKLKQEEAEEYDPENFRAAGAFTTFRVSWFPAQEVADKRKLAHSLAEAVQASRSAATR